VLGCITSQAPQGNDSRARKRESLCHTPTVGDDKRLRKRASGVRPGWTYRSVSSTVMFQEGFLSSRRLKMTARCVSGERRNQSLIRQWHRCTRSRRPHLSLGVHDPLSKPRFLGGQIGRRPWCLRWSRHWMRRNRGILTVVYVADEFLAAVVDIGCELAGSPAVIACDTPGCKSAALSLNPKWSSRLLKM
jgi:hypothetical protein